MSRLIKTTMLVLVLLLAGSAVAQDIQPYTFGYMSFPDGQDDQYRFNWLRVGMRYNPTPDLPGKMLVRTEFDITKDSFDGAFKYGYVEWTNNVEGLGDVSVIAGKFLGPVHYVWPGPQQTRTHRLTVAQAKMVPYMYCTGAQVRWKGPVDVRIASVNAAGTDDQTALTGWANWQGLQVYFVEDLSVGCAFTRSQAWWLNGTVGVTHYDDGEIDNFWLEYYLEQKGVRLSAVLEMEEYEDEELGLTLDIPYAKFSSLRLDYFTKDDTFRSGLTFSY